jgi:hypothetical protein
LIHGKGENVIDGLHVCVFLIGDIFTYSNMMICPVSFVCLAHWIF